MVSEIWTSKSRDETIFARLILPYRIKTFVIIIFFSI